MKNAVLAVLFLLLATLGMLHWRQAREIAELRLAGRTAANELARLTRERTDAEARLGAARRQARELEAELRLHQRPSASPALPFDREREPTLSAGAGTAGTVPTSR